MILSPIRRAPPSVFSVSFIFAILAGVFWPGDYAAAAVNVALATNGAVATASSTYSGGYPASSVNDGDRKGTKAGAGGYWNDATANSYPDWVQIDFAATQTINEIDVFTVQDNYLSPSTPTPSMQFSQYGVTDFEVRYWTGATWADVPGGYVTGNRNVWRQFTFANISTGHIRVLVNNALGNWSRIVEIEAYQTSPVNVALAANGGIATASSTYSGGYPASSVNDGDRKGTKAGAGGYWNDATANSYPDWVQIDFAATQTINEIDVFTVQDNYLSPSTPTPSMQFSQYGVTDFEVQYWTGATWADVPGGYVTGNRNVWRQFTFANISTGHIRVLVNNALGNWSRIVEIEAYQTSPVNVALAANGGIATASSTYSGGYPASSVNDGDRKGTKAGAGGYWNDATANSYPDWVQIDFAATQTINEIDVFTVQDNYLSPSTPTPSMQFSQYGVTDFEVQYWTGATWADVPGGYVTGNRNVWRQFTFANISTGHIRVLVNNALGNWSRIVEIEAYQVGLSIPSGPQIWIALRADGLPGTGTQVDPYDGSTMAKLDALMSSFSSTNNLAIYLGPGTFRTAATHSWTVKPGWVIQGAGMYNTTVQMGGAITSINYGTCFASPGNISTDNVVIQDLTVDCNWAELSQTAPAGANGEKDCAIGAIYLFGSNNLIQRVRSLNNYGSWANARESFVLGLAAPSSNDSTGNIICYCRAESPQGNYAAPFALHGSDHTVPLRINTNCSAYNNTAIGINDGLHNGFSSGGLNGANVQNCEVHDNSFTDCMGAFYSDTGTFDTVKVYNNTVVRGWLCVGFDGPDAKQDIEIYANTFSVQNRIVGGGSYAINLGYGPTTNLSINNNTISFDSSGAGLTQFWGVAASLLTTATISDNVISPSYNSVSGFGLTMFNNKTPSGTLLSGLN